MGFRQVPALMAVYERLRKRSYRRKLRRMQTPYAHRRYVQGVKDALNGVADD